MNSIIQKAEYKWKIKGTKREKKFIWVGYFGMKIVILKWERLISKYSHSLMLSPRLEDLNLLFLVFIPFFLQ
jgi:hypothetical protein